MDTPGLLWILRQRLTGTPGQAPTPGIIAAAHAHRLAGVLYQREVDAGRRPEGSLQAAWAGQLAGHLARLSWAQRHWPADIPRPVRFKGSDLADHLYPNPGCRGAQDLDLLLPEPHWSRAARALRRHANTVQLPHSERWPWSPPEALGFSAGAVLIELHRTPGPPGRWRVDGAAIYARSQPAAAGWGRAPAPADRALLWLVNAAKAGFHGDLAMWWDLALMRRRWPDLSPSPTAGLRRPWSQALAGLAALGWGPAAGAGRAPRTLAWPPHEHEGLGYQLDKLQALGPPRAVRYLVRRAVTGLVSR